ncbi:MAG: right-handed parallel beta-helix repeat-containing protein, partial [Candidatus Kariarchaeaceae archaeon]
MSAKQIIAILSLICAILILGQMFNQSMDEPRTQNSFQESTSISNLRKNQSFIYQNTDTRSQIELHSDPYQEHVPISIDGDSDFHFQAFGNWDLGYTRNGSASKPYVITGYNITSSTSNLIDIRNTDVYFEISDNVLDGIDRSYDGIYFNNTNNGMISNNKIFRADYGVRLIVSSSNNVILNNSIYYNSKAVA